MKTCYENPIKKRHNTKKDAETAILLLGKPELRVYHCVSCQGWHLTSSAPDK